MQASRKCTFAPLAGAKAPDPDAAFRRELARPQAAERKNGRQVQNRRGRWWRPPPRIVRHRKPCAGLLCSSLYPEPPQKERRTYAACGRFSLTNFQKGLQSLPRLYIIASEDTSQRTTQHGNLCAFPLAFWATQRRNRVNELF